MTSTKTQQKNGGKTYSNSKDHGKRKRRCQLAKIDFVLASKNINKMTEKDKENEKKRKTYFNNLKKKRLKISKALISVDKKTLFWHIHAPFEVLADTAEDLNVRLPTVKNDIGLKSWYDKFMHRFFQCWIHQNPFQIADSYFPEIESYFSDHFDKNRLNEYKNGKNPDELFSQTERSRLVSYILESTTFGDKDSEVGKECLISHNIITAAFPCHDGPLLQNDKQPVTNNRQKLSKEWASFRHIFKNQPINGICDYFGVKIAFYFAWIGFYTTWLVPASFIGVMFFFFGCLSNLWFIPVQEICNSQKPFLMCPLCDKCSFHFLHNSSCMNSQITQCFDNDGTPFFAVFMSIWSVFYLEYWKRKQWDLSYEWHTLGFHEEEVVRPQYIASAKKLRRNPVTQKLEPALSHKGKSLKIASEASVVLFFITLVIAALIGVVIYRAVIFSLLNTTSSSFQKHSKIIVTGTAATINLIVINILKLVYNKLALIMTEWENPRTRSSYEKSFTLKMFWFQFCNTFASVFYVAFFKSELFVGHPGHYRRFGTKRSRLEGCSEQGCFMELCVQLVILMGGQQLLGNFVEICWPMMQKKYKTWRSNLLSSTKNSVSDWEKDYQLSKNEELQLFPEYQEVVLQYGFVTMFVAAFPLAPLIALITNLVEIRIDAINMVKSFRRPVAYKSEGIGVWYDILVTLTTLAVLVNGFVLSLTSEFIPRLVYQNRYSVDGTLRGYVNWSLSIFNTKDFPNEERPDEKEMFNRNINVTYCRYTGFHEPQSPYKFNMEHWYLMTIRLVFAFLFQWTVTGAGRILAWIIPDRPRSLEYKIKRQEFLAKEALRKYKIKSGKRKADKEHCSTEELESEASIEKKNHQYNRYANQNISTENLLPKHSVATIYRHKKKEKHHKERQIEQKNELKNHRLPSAEDKTNKNVTNQNCNVASISPKFTMDYLSQML